MGYGVVMEPEPSYIFTERVRHEPNPLGIPAIQPLHPLVTPQFMTWERLESLRLRRLGIPNRYSRHCNIIYNNQAATMKAENKRIQCSTKAPPAHIHTGEKGGKKANNSIAPFYTHAKPTCGYFFSRDTDNRKRNFGIPPSDLVAWRSSNPVQ